MCESILIGRRVYASLPRLFVTRCKIRRTSSTRINRTCVHSNRQTRALCYETRRIVGAILRGIGRIRPREEREIRLSLGTDRPSVHRRVLGFSRELGSSLYGSGLGVVFDRLYFLPRRNVNPGFVSINSTCSVLLPAVSEGFVSFTVSLLRS